jgi:molecular chaperone GrpE (heat shock protein)
MNNVLDNILNLISENKENIDEDKVASTIAQGITLVLDKFNLTLPRKELEEVAQLYSQRLDT